MKLKSPLKALATALQPLQNRALRSFIAAALILHFTLYTLHSPAAEPLCWERTPNRPAPAQFDVFHGESIDFRCTFTGFGALPFDGASDVRLWYQTNGMGAAWWSIPATVSSNVLAATFTPDCDPGAERLTVFFGAPSNAYAAAQVRFRNSPGAHPNDLDPPSVLDWQAELAAATNDLFKSFAPTITNTYTKAETDARIAELAPRTSLAPATNYTDEVTGALSNALVTGAMQVWNAFISQESQHANYADVAGALSDGTSQRSGAQIFTQLDAASRITTNDVCAIVTNEVAEYTTNDTWICNNPTGEEWAPEWNGTGWRMPVVEILLPEDATSYTLKDEQSPEPGQGDYIFTRIASSKRNALGLARLPDITNTVTKAYVEELGIESGIQFEEDPHWEAAKGGYATTGTVAQVSEAVGTLWSYVYGDSVWIAVTNYMRTIGGVSPSFQLWEVRDGATNLVYWSKEEITNVTHDLIYDCKTNLEATVRNAVAEMPDKAWSKYQSATGNEAPEGVTIVSTPTIQLTGGGEWYRYVDVASNSVWFLKSNGLHTFGGDTNGYFRILDDEGNATFEVRKTDSYLVDAVASSVHFDASGNFCVSFESNIEPVIYTTASLESPNFLPQGDDPNVTVTWTQSGGTYTATLEQAVKGPSLFAYAKVEVQGETVIRNAVPTDLQGGIIVNGVKYNVGTAIISGHTVLTLTPRN